MPVYALRVNGVRREVEVPAELPLLWLLRDVLDLTGTKYGCGRGLCGACTIHLDGEPARSCTVTAGGVGDRRITTIEGLGDGGLHPVQRAWVEEDVPQCGFCQAGQLMAAAALLRRTQRPTNADIDDALAGNICRCGTYDRIRRAIHRAAGAPAGA